MDTQHATRRTFLKTAATGAALTAQAIKPVHAGEDNTIRIALVGCGGRGTGAAINALSTKGPTKLVAMADVFTANLQTCLRNLQRRFPKQVDVPPDRRFIGFDAYRKAIDSLRKGDVVIFATPPAFRPLHFEYAVEKGVNVFMEKSFAVDAPGVRRILAAGKKATEKNLKVAGGLMSRHYPPLEEAVLRIHDGAIGKVITCWAYREHGPVGFKPRKPGLTEMGHQIRNYSNFTWLNGSFFLDWLIHNLDVCCWVKGAWPISAQGQGGRQVRNVPDQMFDHYAVEFTFPDGTRLFAQGRHMANCWGFFGDIIHGATGSAVLGEGIKEPTIYRGHLRRKEDILWGHRGRAANPYQVEHDLLFDAIRNDRPYNETERCAYATLVGIMGRMAAFSGKEITWEKAMNSNLVLAPGIENYTMETKPPVVPDENGRYPVAMPGFTKAF